MLPEHRAVAGHQTLVSNIGHPALLQTSHPNPPPPNTTLVFKIAPFLKPLCILCALKTGMGLKEGMSSSLVSTWLRIQLKLFGFLPSLPHVSATVCQVSFGASIEKLTDISVTQVCRGIQRNQFVCKIRHSLSFDLETGSTYKHACTHLHVSLRVNCCLKQNEAWSACVRINKQLACQVELP